MKHIITTLLLPIAIALFATEARAISLFSHQFIFKGDVQEWSEPIETTLITDNMRKKGQAEIPVRVRVRVKRKIFRGCEYEVEVTNMDRTRRLTYDMDGRSQKPKGHKLDPGETETYLTDTFLKKNCPEVADCGNGNCEYAVVFDNVKVKE